MSEFFGFIAWLTFLYFALASLHVFILSVAARFFPRKFQFIPADSFRKIAILIPAYKEDAVILSSVQSHLKLDYPSDYFDVFVIADSLRPETLSSLAGTRAKILNADFDKSTVTRSVRFGLDHIDSSYDVTLICDADNVLAANFLKLVNEVFCAGKKAMQSRRFTKNLNTDMAVLDSFSEMINNHLFRKGNYALGLSSCLIGSGLAIESGLLKECFTEVRAIGFDRDVQLALSKRGVKIHYIEDAVCYDEKISSDKAYVNQRRRWISRQFYNLAAHFKNSFLFLGRKGGIDYFNFAIIQNIFLNRILTLGAIFFLGMFSLILVVFKSPVLFFYPVWWFGIFAIYALSLLMGIPKQFFTSKLLAAFLTIPKTFFLTIGILFKLKGASKTFIHTEHKPLEFDSTILKEK